MGIMLHLAYSNSLNTDITTIKAMWFEKIYSIYVYVHAGENCMT